MSEIETIKVKTRVIMPSIGDEKTRNEVRNDKVEGIKRFVSTIRSKASEFKKAVANVSDAVNSLNEIEGNQIIEKDCCKSIVRCSSIFESVMPSVNLGYGESKIAIQNLVVSNLSNEKLLVPCSFQKEHEYVFSTWNDSDRDQVDNYRLIKLEGNPEETQAFSESANLAGYADYTDATALAKSLKFSKGDFDALTTGEKNAIDSKIKNSRGKMDRMTRLVIGAMYYIALETGGGEVDFRCEKRVTDEIMAISPSNMAAVCVREDLAFVHCNRPKENEYIAFLYIISREFPYCRNILERRNGIKDMYSNFLSLEIEEEASRVCIMCDETPAWNGTRQMFTFNAHMWFSYLVNYSRSVGIEHRLGEAYSVACTLMHHKLLPNITLPARRSAGEVFQRSHATKNVEGLVPNRFQLKEMIFGALSVASSAALIYKDLRSHELITSANSGGSRSMSTQLIKNRQTRERWYRYIGSSGLSDAVQILRRIDALDYSSGAHLANIDNYNALPLWCMSQLDFKKDIRFGFSELWRRCNLQTRLKLKGQSSQNRSQSLALMRNLELLEGANTKARLVQNRPIYRDQDCDIAESWLHPGEVSVLKGGMRNADPDGWEPEEMSYVKVDAPVEYVEENDDVILPVSYYKSRVGGLKEKNKTMQVKKIYKGAINEKEFETPVKVGQKVVSRENDKKEINNRRNVEDVIENDDRDEIMKQDTGEERGIAFRNDVVDVWELGEREKDNRERKMDFSTDVSQVEEHVFNSVAGNETMAVGDTEMNKETVEEWEGSKAEEMMEKEVAERLEKFREKVTEKEHEEFVRKTMTAEKKKRLTEIQTEKAIRKMSNSMPEIKVGVKENKKISEEIRKYEASILGVSGSLKIKDAAWMFKMLGKVIEINDRYDDAEKIETSKMLAMWSRAPKRMYKPLIVILEDICCQCVEQNDFSSDVAAKVGVHKGCVHKMLKNRTFKDFLLRGGVLPGVGKYKIKLSDKMVDNIKEVIIGIRGDVLMVYRSEQNRTVKENITYADKEDVRRWLMWFDRAESAEEGEFRYAEKQKDIVQLWVDISVYK